jgi:hypothetical protein
MRPQKITFGEMRSSGVISLVFAPTTNAATRSRCRPIGGGTTFDYPTLSRGPSVRPAGNVAQMSVPISARPAWALTLEPRRQLRCLVAPDALAARAFEHINELRGVGIHHHPDKRQFFFTETTDPGGLVFQSRNCLSPKHLHGGPTPETGRRLGNFGSG